MSKIYVILVEYCMKLTLLSALKVKNYYKHVVKSYNFSIKSGIGKWYIPYEILVHTSVLSVIILTQTFKIEIDLV